VDKKLGGVNAVQTLSRLNRTLPPEKKGTMVIDFANEADTISRLRAVLRGDPSEATDPNLLYEHQTRLAAFPVYTEADVDAFAKVYFDPKAKQDRLYARTLTWSPTASHRPGAARAPWREGPSCSLP